MPTRDRSAAAHADTSGDETPGARDARLPVLVPQDRRAPTPVPAPGEDGAPRPLGAPPDGLARFLAPPADLPRLPLPVSQRRRAPLPVLAARAPRRLAAAPGPPATVVLLTLLFAAALFTHAVAVPAYRPPDEATHVDMVRFAAGEQLWPFTGGRSVSREVTATFDVVGWDYDNRAGEPPLPRDAAPPRAERPSFDAAARDVPSFKGNQMPQHPPLYYEVAGRALTLAQGATDAPWPFDQTVGFLRLVSAAMVLPLPLLAWATARRLGSDSTVAGAAAALPLGIPLLSHIGSSVNNDNLLVLLVALTTWLTARVLTGDRSLVTAVAVGVSGGLALLTKGFALFIPGWLLAVYTLAAWRAARHPTACAGPGWRAGGASKLPGRRVPGWAQRLRPGAWARPAAGSARPGVRAAVATSAAGAGALALALALGSPWWIRNLVVLDTIQPSFARPPPAGPGFTPVFGEWLDTFVVRLNARFWGQFGWRHVALPEWVMWTATALVLVGLALALVGRCRALRRGVVALLAPLAGLLAIVLYGAWGHYADSGVAALMNGRYLYPAVVGVGVAAASGWGWLLRGRTRLLPLAGVAAAVAMQLLAVHTLLLRFWGDGQEGGLRESAAALLAWSPWPPDVVVGVWVATGVLVVLLTGSLVRDALRWRRL